MIDALLHLDPPESGVIDDGELGRIIAALDEAGVARAVVMETPNEGRMPHAALGDAYRARLCAIAPGRVTALCGGGWSYWLHRAEAVGWDGRELETRLGAVERALAAGACGIGELGARMFRKLGRQPETRFSFDLEPFLRLVALADRHRVPLVLHAEPRDGRGGVFDDEIFAAVDDLLRRFTALHLVMSHTAMTSPERLRRLLERHHRVSTTIKIVKNETLWGHLGRVADDDGRFHRPWRLLFEDMPERFMICSDFKLGRVGAWAKKIGHRPFTLRRYVDRIAMLRRALSDLSETAAAMIAHDNAETTWPRR